jgi:hypothetical protein
LGWYPKVDLAEGFAATLKASRQDRGGPGMARAYALFSMLALLAGDPT